MNSIGDPETRVKYAQVLRDWLTRPDIFESLNEEDRRRTVSNPLRVLDSKSFESLGISAQAPNIKDYLSVESGKTFEYIVKTISDIGINFRINPTLVRGLDYYNDFCFEVKPQRHHVESGQCLPASSDSKADEAVYSTFAGKSPGRRI